MSKIQTHYDNLKVSRDAPDFVIRAAYKTLTQKYHPDKNTDPDAPRVMLVINRAYQVLSDPELRAEHDAWIRAQEAKAGGYRAEGSPSDTGNGVERTTPPPSQGAARRPVVFPRGGSAPADSLPERVLSVVAARSRGLCADQTHVPLGPTVFGTLVRAAIPVGCLLLAYGWALSSRWPDNLRMWIGAISALAGLYFGAQVYKCYLIRTKPFRPSLNITPLYVVETTWDHASYWPITLASDIRAVNHHRNGMYTHTEIDIELAGAKRSYTTDYQYLYPKMVDRLNEGLGRFRAAEQRGDQSLLDSVDELKGVPLRDPPGILSSTRGLFAGCAGGCIAFLLAFAGLVAINQEQPARNVAGHAKETPNQPRYQSRPPAISEPEASTRDYIAERIGAARIPGGPAYIGGEPVSNTDGLSTVTVDNTGTTGDVLVKLVAIDGGRAWPVRTFFIPAGRKFTAEDIRPGTYEIRYMGRNSGDASKSEMFTLEETETANGTEYTTMTLTLYRVAGGNMHMQSIDPSDF